MPDESSGGGLPPIVERADFAGEPEWPPVTEWPGGRPIAQWPRIDDGGSDDPVPAGPAGGTHHCH
jgi:hypothetical protein